MEKKFIVRVWDSAEGVWVDISHETGEKEAKKICRECIRDLDSEQYKIFSVE